MGVYSKGELIPAYAVQPGSVVDGKSVVAITNVTGHPTNVVTLRQDIMVNGLCATWLTEEFMPVARFQFVWNVINHNAQFFPTVMFAITQAIADFFVPLLDGGIIGNNTILAVMFSTGFLLFCTSAAMLWAFTLFYTSFWGNGPIFKSFVPHQMGSFELPVSPNPFGNSNELFPFGTFFEECFLQGKGVCTPFALFVYL